MDYIFESMMMQYDEMVVNEYCYGESYYTEAEKKGLLEKIGEFISNLCEKVMNLVKSLVNKIAGKDVFVKVPKEMVDRVKKAESWFDLFKKAVDAIKRGVIKAIKELVELMKKHPLMTTAVVASAGFIFVKAGAYKKMATTLATIGGRIKDAVKYLIGKKDMVDKNLYDATVATLKSSQVALNKAQADLTACKVENAKKDEIITNQKDRINTVSKIASDRRVAGNKMKETIKDQDYLLDVSKKSIIKLGDENTDLRDKLENSNTELQNEIYNSTMSELRNMSAKDKNFGKFLKTSDGKSVLNKYIDYDNKTLTRSGRKHLMNNLSDEYAVYKKN